MSAPIESYALIGDCETAGLVGRDGSIDWLCWPRFDSDSTFGALLGSHDNGRWKIAPVEEPQRISRCYRDSTLILETTYETGSGAVTLVDFMPIRGKNSDVVRIVKGIRGRVPMHMELVIRFGYGQIVPRVRRIDDEDGRALEAVAGPDMVLLHSDVATHGENAHTVADFEVGEGDEVGFVLTYGSSYLPPPKPIDIAEALEETETFWRNWSSKCDSDLSSRLDPAGYDAVIRSLVTLKALTYAPTGGIVAAATTSLPEQIGGARNWDYRFCWLRDATMMLLALMDAGYYDESEAWRNWLLRAVAGSPDQVQIMYGLAGERRLTEWSVPWLRGYEGSLPVRVGNAAHDQLQLDVYGELMDALHQARRGGLPESEPAWALQRTLIGQLGSIWKNYDSGIWEVRGSKRQFTYSRIMAWVAVDRCIRSVEEFGLDGPLDQWRALRDEIHEDVCTNGYDPELKSFVQSYGSKAVDASLLLIPTLGFLPASDARYRGTVAEIERRLSVDGLMRRYDTDEADDGLEGEEGTFLACSFWLVDAYAMTGRVGDARKLLDRLLALRNDVGLLSEEYDPHAKRMLGNFPQVFSHVALVHSVLRLAKATQSEEREPTDGKPG